MRFRCRVVPCCLLVFASACWAAENRAKAATTTATRDAAAFKGGIVMDAATGNVLFEDRADTVGPPASMAKLMTYLLVHDRLASGALTLETPIRITRGDAAMGGTQVYLDPRETFSVEELIFAMMVQSANDAAHALARVCGGSVPAFVELMNLKAGQLGMTRTTFRTPHGLPPASRRVADGDLTTPRDFAVLSRHLIQNTHVLHYTSIRTRPFSGELRPEPMIMRNHNNLLGKVGGVDGLKTGFTNGAGFCLAATAHRNGRRVIVVTMGSPDGKTRDLKVTELLERGFAALPPVAALPVPVDSPLRPAPLAAPRPRPIPVGSEPPIAPAPAADNGPVIRFSIPKR
jgi:D-alanyl-D-alanine carboxypeptidase